MMQHAAAATKAYKTELQANTYTFEWLRWKLEIQQTHMLKTKIWKLIGWMAIGFVASKGTLGDTTGE